jgi:hypothetical protein
MICGQGRGQGLPFRESVGKALQQERGLGWITLDVFSAVNQALPRLKW